MFGNKKDGFKYENEVKSLIQEATISLHQRILSLETQNQQLIQEMYHLKNGICQDFRRLEQRITDFTDVWHPIMIQNINRIKEDLEKTIVETEREDIKKIQKELEQKMATIAEDSSAGLMDHVLVGYYQDYTPIFVHKDSNTIQLYEKLKGNRGDISCTLIFDSLKHFKNAYYDPSLFQQCKTINKKGEILFDSFGNTWTPVEQIIQNHQVKHLYKLCQEYGIKFVINGEDRVNGVPIKILFEE